MNAMMLLLYSLLFIIIYYVYVHYNFLAFYNILLSVIIATVFRFVLTFTFWIPV